MFQFPWFPLPVLCVHTGVPPAKVVGFPIRTSTDQNLVSGSPWLIAATHVLRRLLEPRHPPHALSSLLTSISLTSTRRLTADLVEHELEIEAQTPALRSGLMQHKQQLELNSCTSYALFKERVTP